MNVTATLRRSNRLGLTAALIEEHCFMREGSKLSLLNETSTYGLQPLKLFSPQGNLIASVTRHQNNVIIRNAKGGVVSDSYVAGDRVLHYADGERKVFYGYSEIDTEKNILRHYLMDATGKRGVFVGQDVIVSEVAKGTKTSVRLEVGMMAELEAAYPAEFLPAKLEPAAVRVEQQLVLDPQPPRNANFKVAKGTWSKGNLTYKLEGFTINEGMVATAVIRVSNSGNAEHRIGIDAAGGVGFQAAPVILAKLEDSSGTNLPCTSVRGAYYQAKLAGMSDLRHVIGETNYDPMMVGRWKQAMNEIAAGKEHVITLKFTLDQEEVAASLDLNFRLRASFYAIVLNRGQYGTLITHDVIFEGIVPSK